MTIPDSRASGRGRRGWDWLLFAFVACACSESGGELARPDAGPVGSDAAAAATWTQVYNEIIDRHCALSGCHVGGTPTGNLNMDSIGVAYANLVGVQTQGTACGSLDAQRVVEGDASSSVLFSKVSETAPICGSRMPLAGTPLNAIQIRMIESWINAGAEDN